MLQLFPKIGKRTAERIYAYVRSSQNPVELLSTGRLGEVFKSVQKDIVATW